MLPSNIRTELNSFMHALKISYLLYQFFNYVTFCSGLSYHAIVHCVTHTHTYTNSHSHAHTCTLHTRTGVKVSGVAPSNLVPPSPSQSAKVATGSSTKSPAALPVASRKRPVGGASGSTPNPKKVSWLYMSGICPPPPTHTLTKCN